MGPRTWHLQMWGFEYDHKHTNIPQWIWRHISHFDVWDENSFGRMLLSTIQLRDRTAKGANLTLRLFCPSTGEIIMADVL